MAGPASSAARSSAGRLPDFFVIGAPRAGTTSLAAYLDAHPGVFMDPDKEPRFFDRFYGRGEDWYRSRYEDAAPRQLVGEATATYLFSEQAPTRIARHVPRAKLIAILRNPVDRAYSNYWYMQTAYPDDRPFADLARAEMRDPGAPEELGFHPYLAIGRYVHQLERVCRSFPRSSLLVFLLDDLRTEPRSVFRDLCTSLDLDPDVVPSEVGRTFNPAPRLRSPGLRRAMLRGTAWKWLPKRIADAIDGWNRTRKPYPPMDPELRRELVEWYREDNEALAAWLGRHLSAWNV